MAGKKEKSITFKCDDDFDAWLSREVREADISASTFIRQALLLAAPQIKAIRGLDRLSLEDIKPQGGGQ